MIQSTVGHTIIYTHTRTRVYNVYRPNKQSELRGRPGDGTERIRASTARRLIPVSRERDAETRSPPGLSDWLRRTRRDPRNAAAPTIAFSTTPLRPCSVTTRRRENVPKTTSNAYARSRVFTALPVRTSVCSGRWFLGGRGCPAKVRQCAHPWIIRRF